MKVFAMLFISLAFVSFINTATAEIKITDADAVFETSLQSVSIPTQAAPVTTLFINSVDAILTKELSSVSIPTQAVPLTRLFIVGADAISTKDLVPLGGKAPVVPSPISSFTLSLDEGLNMVSLPIKPQLSFTARSFVEKLASTMIIRYDTKQDEFLAFVPEVFAGDGFPIEGGRGYIVNLLDSMEVVFTGAAWANAPSKPISAAPSKEESHWAFAVCGTVYDRNRLAQSYDLAVTVENLGTGNVAEARVGQLENGRYTVAFVDPGRKDVVNPGDSLSVRLRDIQTGAISKPIVLTVTPSDIVRSYVEVALRMEYLAPEKSALLQNYPNPFNPDTWIPYQLEKDADVVVRIYMATGQLVRMLNLGYKRAGFYTNKERAAYWDGENEAGEHVASGVYFYSIEAGDFKATKKLVIAK